uniref:C2H2-type domain-containing protein n=1 Tax=Ditylenchus dipsaci TaxID=166011 RepID=A0A915D894_9BILA
MSLFCCLCSKACSDREALETHLGVEHFDYYPFACSYCMQNNSQAKFSTKDAIRRHCIQDHGLKKFHIRLWMSEEIDNDEQEIQKCIEKSMRINQNTAILPSPVFQTNQSQPMIEYPSGSSTSGSQVDERSLLEDPKVSNETHKGGLIQLEDDGLDCKKRLHKSGSTLTGDSLPTIAAENFRFSMPAGQPRSQERGPNGITRQMAVVPKKATHSSISQDKNVAKKTPSPNIEPEMASSLRRQAFLNATHRHTSTDLAEESASGVNRKSQPQNTHQHSTSPFPTILLQRMPENAEFFPTSTSIHLKPFDRRRRRPVKAQARRPTPSNTHIAVAKQASRPSTASVAHFSATPNRNFSHLKLPVFECRGCGETFQEYSGLSVSSHIKSHHKGNTSFIQDNRPIYRDPLQEACLEFFASKS